MDKKLEKREAKFLPETENFLLDSPLILRRHPDWWTAILEESRDLNPLSPQHSRPGLFKPVHIGGGKNQWEFHVPAKVLSGEFIEPDWEEEADDGFDPQSALQDWAEATARGKLSDWEAPEMETARAALRNGQLTLQSGPFMRQGELICTKNRLAVRMPIVQAQPDLDEQRGRWLSAVLTDAQDRWRMVRIHEQTKEANQENNSTGQPSDFDPPAGVHAWAEVDLTGAPIWSIEHLLAAALDALRWVVGQLVWPVEFLVNPSVQARTWNQLPMRGQPAERR